MSSGMKASPGAPEQVIERLRAALIEGPQTADTADILRGLGLIEAVMVSGDPAALDTLDAWITARIEGGPVVITTPSGGHLEVKEVTDGRE